MPTTTPLRATAVAGACVALLLLAACRPVADAGDVTGGVPTSSGTPTAVASPTVAPADANPSPDVVTAQPTATVEPVAAPTPSPTPGPTPTATPTPPVRTVTLPEPGARFEYQLGGPDEPAAGTTVVVRDSTAPPTGLYDVCYVNGFQTQPDETERLVRTTPELVLHHGGEPLRDEGWPDEALYDITRPDLRTRVADRVGRVIDACAAAGFDAVEVDNLDSYTRSLGQITPQDSLAYVALLIERAHAAGLAFAQKNTAELTSEVRALGADLVVAEECHEWEECDVYTSAYPVVLAVEYDGDAFAAGCAAPGRAPGLSLVLRDRDVSPRSQVGAVHESC